MNNSKTMTGIIMAAAIGAALGMLVAPKKGAESRQSLLASVDEFADDLLEIKEKVIRISEQVKSQISAIGEDLKAKAENVEQSVSDMKTIADHARRILS